MRWITLALVLLLAGCGGTPAASPPTSSTPTSTKAAQADQATVDLAKAANFVQADLGGTWQVHAEAKQAEPVSGCTLNTPIAELPEGARQIGAVLKVPDTTWYAYSASWVFPDEASAIKWTQIRHSAEYVECRRGELEKEQKAADARFSVVTASTTDAGIGTNGYEGYTRYQVKADMGQGPQDANGTFDRFTYRKGRVAFGVSVDFVTGPNDPPDLHTTVSNDLTRALEAVYGRVK